MNDTSWVPVLGQAEVLQTTKHKVKIFVLTETLIYLEETEDKQINKYTTSA